VPLPSALAAEKAPHAAPPADGIPFGPYWLMRRLKSGGMADVYEAVSQPTSGAARPLAIKRIQLPLTESDDFVRMFMDEAKIAVLLNHPSIVQFFEFGHVGAQYYIAMEYVHGRDFDAVLQLTRRVGSRIPVGIALYVMLQVLEALDYAHNKRDAHGQGLGIVHRDVSPANVLCGFDGQVKLADFGIAKAATKMVATQPGILLGKLGYMAPEQLKSGRVDHRVDVFSAGVVLWEALAGRRLFHADNDAATMHNVVHAEIPALRSLRQDVPPALEAAVAEALARDPRRRPARASELAARLRQILAQLDISKPENDFIVFMAALFEGEPAGEPIFSR
jgi:serine/threonine protein kinase